jgi:hypothetical protein
VSERLLRLLQNASPGMLERVEGKKTQGPTIGTPGLSGCAPKPSKYRGSVAAWSNTR